MNRNILDIEMECIIFTLYTENILYVIPISFLGSDTQEFLCICFIWPHIYWYDVRSSSNNFWFQISFNSQSITWSCHKISFCLVSQGFIYNTSSAENGWAGSMLARTGFFMFLFYFYLWTKHLAKPSFRSFRKLTEN